MHIINLIVAARLNTEEVVYGRDQGGDFGVKAVIVWESVGVCRTSWSSCHTQPPILPSPVLMAVVIDLTSPEYSSNSSRFSDFLRFSEFLTQYQALIKKDLISSSTSSSQEHKWKIPVEDGESSCTCVTWANTHRGQASCMPWESHMCSRWEWEKYPPSKGNLLNGKCVLERRQRWN